MNGLSIIVVSYIPGGEIFECISSLKNLVTCPHEIIICDNSPERGSQIERLSIEFPDLIIIHNPDNPGFGTANNAGAKIAKYPYLLFINPDATLRSELKSPSDFFSVNTGIVSGYCLDSKGNYKLTAGIFPTNGRMLLFFSRRLDRRPPLNNGHFQKSEVNVDYAEGSFYLMRADVFTNLGGFDEKIFLYGEDYELSYRFFKKGYQNKINRQLQYIHDGGFNHGRESHIISGLLYFAKKHLSPKTALSVRAFLIFRTVILILVSCASGVFSARHRRRINPLLKSLRRAVS